MPTLGCALLRFRSPPGQRSLRALRKGGRCRVRQAPIAYSGRLPSLTLCVLSFVAHSAAGPGLLDRTTSSLRIPLLFVTHPSQSFLFPSSFAADLCFSESAISTVAPAALQVSAEKGRAVSCFGGPRHHWQPLSKPHRTRPARGRA
jgi:hypothetical protein